MKYREGDLGDWLDLKNAELTVYFMWNESLVGIDSIDVGKQVVRFSHPARTPLGAWGTHEYVVWNTQEGLLEPGQWYLDRTRGRVYYQPLENEDMTTVVVIAPVLDKIINIEAHRASC